MRGAKKETSSPGPLAYEPDSWKKKSSLVKSPG